MVGDQQPFGTRAAAALGSGGQEMKLSVLGFALRALSRRKARAFALGGGLAFAVALVAAVIFMTEALRGEAERAHAAHPDIVVQKLVGGRPTTISAAEVAKIRAKQGSTAGAGVGA